jgi:hypothetical protein
MNVGAEATPFILLLIPAPVNVIISCNTFTRLATNTIGGHKRVGIVLSVNAANWMLSVHLFLSWSDVVERIGTNNVPDNVSFWPMNQAHPPHYLCDTDVVENSIPSSDILG